MSSRTEAVRLLAAAAEAMGGEDDGELDHAARALVEAAAMLWSLSGAAPTQGEILEALSCIRAAASVTRFAVVASRSAGG